MDRDEMEALAEAAAKMGDQPPRPEDYEDGTPPQDVEEAAPDVEVESGGLDGEGFEEPEPLDLDALLGIKDDQTEEEPDERPEEPKKERKQGGADTRIAELAAENKLLKEQQELLIKSRIGDRQEAEHQEPQEELSDEVIEWMKPYYEKLHGATMQELRELKETLEPIRQQAQDKNLAGFIGQHVEGFTDKHMSQLREAFSKIPEGTPEHALYGDGVAGAALLAQDLVRRGALDVGQPKKKQSSPLARRHVTESTDAARQMSGGMSDEEKARRIMSTPNAEFRRLLAEYEVD